VKVSHIMPEAAASLRMSFTSVSSHVATSANPAWAKFLESAVSGGNGTDSASKQVNASSGPVDPFSITTTSGPRFSTAYGGSRGRVGTRY